MIKKVGFVCLVALMVLGMSSCGSSKKAPAATYSDLSGEWQVTEMNGRTLNPTETGQTFVFDTSMNTVSGNAGCNRFSGRVEYNPSQRNIIRMLQVASTRMACLDEEKNALENEFLKNLDKVVRFESLSQEGPVRTVALYGIDNTRLFVINKNLLR
ncbi:MAG: META domain-containing protein [Tannerellaceae bacterium]|nr:META domain-containing protein [Tannerellaceae bacterium]